MAGFGWKSARHTVLSAQPAPPVDTRAAPRTVYKPDGLNGWRAAAARGTLSAPSCLATSGDRGWQEHPGKSKISVQSIPPSQWEALHPALRTAHGALRSELKPAVALAKETLNREALCSAPPAPERAPRDAITRWLLSRSGSCEAEKQDDEQAQEAEADRASLLRQCLKHGGDLHRRLRSNDHECDGFASRREFFEAIRALRLDRDIVSRARKRRQQYTDTAAHSQLVIASLFAAFELSTESGRGRGFIRYDELDAALRRFGAERRAKAMALCDEAVSSRVEQALRRTLLRARARAFVAWVDHRQAGQRLARQVAMATARLRSPKQAAALFTWRADWEVAQLERRRLDEKARLRRQARREEAMRKIELPSELPGAPSSVRMALERERSRRLEALARMFPPEEEPERMAGEAARELLARDIW